MTQGFRYLLLLVLSILLSGCAESNREKASGKASIRAVNAIVGAPGVNFLIEERALETIAFKSSMAAQRYDDLSYTFRFELQLPGESDTSVLASQFLDVEAGHDYMFVLDGTVQQPTIRLWDTEERQWQGDETVFELAFAHLNDSLGPVDLYFVTPDTPPVSGNAIATLDNGDRLDATEFQAATYELILTPPGDPDTVLFTSGARNFTPAGTNIVILFDKDPTLTGDINLRLFTASGNASELVDPRFPPQAQFLNAAFGSGPVDIAEDSDFDPPLVSNLAFGERTADIEVTPGTTGYSYTAANNMGAVLFENELTNLAGLRFNRLLVGEPGSLDVINTTSARRPFTTSARYAITHAAANFEALDVYLLPPGDSVSDNSPISAGVPFKFASGMGAVAAGDYELTLTLPGEDTIVAGPVALNLAVGDVVETVFLDTADPNVAEILVYSNVP